MRMYCRKYEAAFMRMYCRKYEAAFMRMYMATSDHLALPGVQNARKAS